MIWIGVILLPARLVLLVIYTAVLVIIASPLALTPRTRWLFLRLIVLKVWAHGQRWIFGFWVTVRNLPTREDLKHGVLFVGNHVSYWDAFTVASVTLKTFVGKAEVRKIPLVGFGAHLTGILFVERDKMGSRVAMVRTVEEALQRGENVMVFPEGTTEHEPKLLPFHQGVFKAVTDTEQAGFPVKILPLAISYSKFQDHAWGAQNGATHFLQSASMLFHHAAIVFGDCIEPKGRDARALAHAAHAECERLFKTAYGITGP